MATAAPITTIAPANIHSWLQRALARFLPAVPASSAVAPSSESTILDLRLILRRIEHARREQNKWDACYLGKTISQTIVSPLMEMSVSGDLDRLRHGAAFALKPIAAIASADQRGKVDVAGELEEAAEFVRAAIVDAEAERHGAR